LKVVSKLISGGIDLRILPHLSLWVIILTFLGLGKWRLNLKSNVGDWIVLSRLINSYKYFNLKLEIIQKI